MESYFLELSDLATSALRGGEVFTATFHGEESDFVRFNHSRVRQAGTVTQRYLSLDLIEGRRHAAGSLSLSGELASDAASLRNLLVDLRQARQFVPEDPHLLYSTEVRNSTRRHGAELPDASEVVAEIQSAGDGRDLVGIYAGGAAHAGFASSVGQRNWFTSESFNLDWSFYLSGDKAVKSAYAGFRWRTDELDAKVADAAQQMRALARPARTIAPGRYAVYLTPAALYEIVLMLNWGGFGLRAHRTKTTPLLKMIEAGVSLDPRICLRENTRDGFAPDFQEAGYLRPDCVELIRAGRYADCLISPRSSLEYGVATNGASEGEAARSIEIDAGGIATAQALRELGTGLYVSNLWYLNFSDRTACRTTGMTRFATFWVESGEIVAPVNVMRFDETIYRVLGSNLIGLTAERETILDPGTYYQRSLDSARLPGALIDDFTLTL
jgi:predicted Zn-dependent protease